MFKICTPLDVTDAQQRTLEAVCDLMLRNGRSPTLREITNYLGLHTLSCPHKQLAALRAKGLVDWEENGDRMIAHSIRVNLTEVR